MNWYSVFYWITVADSVKTFFDTFSNIFTFLAIVTLIAYIIAVCIRVGGKDEYHRDYSAEAIAEINFWVKRCSVFFWWSAILCVFTWAGYVFTPTKKDGIIIVTGGALGNFITTDSSAKAIPAELTKFVKNYIQKEAVALELEESPKTKLTEKLEDLTKEEIIEYLKKDTSISIK